MVYNRIKTVAVQFRPYIWLLALLLFGFCRNGSVDKDKQHTAFKSESTNAAYASSYDLSKPVKKWELPAQLKEVSGNTWIDNNHLLVIEDLHPNLYLIRLDQQADIEKTIPFLPERKKKFDIEDLTIADNTVYALWSHGVVFKIINWRNSPQTTEIPTFLDKENNTEGICFDPVTGNLLVACKNESDVSDAKKSTRAIYIFNRQTSKLEADPFLLIKKKDFEKKEGEKIDFYPSAVAVHPISHDIFVLSTRGNKCLAEYSREGKLKSFQFIDKQLMPQPEGLCFAPDGTMYISTEGRHGEPAAIYTFDYKHS